MSPEQIITDDVLTPSRKQLLAIMPATRVTIDEEFGVNEAHELMAWALDRRKLIKWDSGAGAFVRTDKRA